MLEKRKGIIITSIIIVLFLVGGYVFIGNPMVAINNQKLESSIKEVKEEQVYLNEIVPFEWDSLYTFMPYESKEEIEKTIGFKSNDIKENLVNEGMVHLLFTKGEKVVSSILGYKENLGYSLDFKQKIDFKEKAKLDNSIKNGIIELKHIE